MVIFSIRPSCAKPNLSYPSIPHTEWLVLSAIQPFSHSPTNDNSCRMAFFHSAKLNVFYSALNGVLPFSHLPFTASHAASPTEWRISIRPSVNGGSRVEFRLISPVYPTITARIRYTPTMILSYSIVFSLLSIIPLTSQPYGFGTFVVLLLLWSPPLPSPPTIITNAIAARMNRLLILCQSLIRSKFRNQPQDRLSSIVSRCHRQPCSPVRPLQPQISPHPGHHNLHFGDLPAFQFECPRRIVIPHFRRYLQNGWSIPDCQAVRSKAIQPSLTPANFPGKPSLHPPLKKHFTNQPRI